MEDSKIYKKQKELLIMLCTLKSKICKDKDKKFNKC